MVIDLYGREALTIEGGQRLRGKPGYATIPASPEHFCSFLALLTSKGLSLATSHPAPTI
jgi:hypothetical protein